MLSVALPRVFVRRFASHVRAALARRQRVPSALVSLGLAFGVLFLASPAAAIPAFARKYETSCQTCHVAFPRLTPFGEAFRRNAYRFPDGGDDAAQKTEPVHLGNEATKDLWPSTVYPGELPGSLPFSLVLDMKAQYGTAFEGHAHADAAADGADGAHASSPASETPATSLRDIGGLARLLAGGSLGTLGGFFAAVSFENTAAPMVERGFVVLTPLSQTGLSLKFGRFEPALHGVSIHRGLLGHQLRLTTTAISPGTFMPEHSLRGGEASGLLFGRVGWHAGLVENDAPIVGELRKDYYGRLEYKLGGMRLDGVDANAQSAAWRERSVMVGASAYKGRQLVLENVSMPGMAMPMNDAFYRVGADLHVVFDDLLFDGVFALQRHSQPAVPNEAATMNLQYAEVTYMTWPWLFPTLRFERSEVIGQDPRAGATAAPLVSESQSRVRSATGAAAAGGDLRGERYLGLLSVNAVIRPNVVARVDVGYGKDPGHQHAEFRMAALNLSTAF